MSIESQLTTTVILKDQTQLLIRPVRISDGDDPQAFKDKFSDKSIIERFLGYIPKISEKLVKELTDIDFKCKVALVGEIEKDGEKEIIGITRIGCECAVKAEFAIIIADAWQGRGLASILMDRMIQVTRQLEYKIIYAYVFSDNRRMIGMLDRRHFLLRHEDGRTMYAELEL